MRVGNNPLATSKAETLAPVVLAVITHLPNTEGYHSQRLEVIRTCIQSMIDGAGGTNYSLLVWDNGSCESLRRWLRSYGPDVLVESENIGKASARACIFRMLPAETIVAMSDDDILYYPGWFEAQKEVLDTFPNVACVTGNPIRTSFRWGCTNTLAWLKAHADLEVGRFIPDKYERDFCVSIGRDFEKHKAGTTRDLDYRGHSRDGLYVYGTSHHCQFISIAGRVVPAMRFDNEAMGDEKPFDIAMDRLGLRLSTTIRYSRHIGNVIHDELRGEIEELELC